MKKFSTFLVLVLTILVTGPFVARAIAGWFVDETTGYVGVNTDSPTAPLDVSGAIYSRLVTATSSSIDWNKGNSQRVALGSSTTLSFSNAQAGGEYKLLLDQDLMGGRDVTWPTSVVWKDAEKPTLSSVPTSTDIVVLTFDGEKYFAFHEGGFMRPKVISSGSLISYWKLDESSGNAVDSYGANTLTNVGSVTYGAGKINNGAQTNMSKLLTTGSSDFEVTGDLSVSVWVKFNSLPSDGGNAGLVVKKLGSNPYDQGWGLFETNMGGEHQIVTEVSTNNSQQKFFGWSPSGDTWYHIVWVYKASAHQSEVFVNGSSLGTQDQINTSIGVTSDDLDIGSYTSNDSYALDGTIDEVGVWSKALTSGEVSSLYNSGAGRQYPF